MHPATATAVSSSDSPHLISSSTIQTQPSSLAPLSHRSTTKSYITTVLLSVILLVATSSSSFVSSLSAAATSATTATNMGSEKRSITNLVIAIAMEAEAHPFITHLSLEEDSTFFPKQTPFKAFRGVHEDCKVTVVTNGKDEVHGTGVDNVGTIPAALATFLALQKLDGSQTPADLLINAGTCGGFQAKGAGIGDVYLTTAVANHDRRIPIPPFIPYGIGKIHSVETKNLAAEIGAKTGICTTGNSLDMHDVDELHIKNIDASVKDMEAAAIAWSCSLFQTPHFGVKVVTDIVDGDKPTQDEFLENLHSASTKLQEALPKVIEHVCGRGHDEL